MKLTRTKFAAAGALLGTLIVFLCVALTVSRPAPKSGIIIQGIPLENWVEDLLRSNDYRAADAVKQAGTNALPLLKEALLRRSTVGNKLWVKLWTQLPGLLQKRFNQPVLAREARMNAVAALRDMPESKFILPDLMARLSDEDAQIRLHTAITMGNIGPEAKAAVPTILEFTRSTSHVMRVYSANALWKITRETEPALSVLESGLQDKTAKFRWAAPYFLEEMGTNAARALPLLVEASKDTDTEVASLAIQALAKVSANSVPVLIEHLKSPDPAIRISAIEALARMGQPAAPAIPSLEALLNDTAKGEPTIIGRAIGKEPVHDAARSALDRIRAELTE